MMHVFFGLFGLVFAVAIVVAMVLCGYWLARWLGILAALPLAVLADCTPDADGVRRWQLTAAVRSHLIRDETCQRIASFVRRQLDRRSAAERELVAGTWDDIEAEPYPSDEELVTGLMPFLTPGRVLTIGLTSIGDVAKVWADRPDGTFIAGEVGDDLLGVIRQLEADGHLVPAEWCSSWRRPDGR